MSFQQSDGLQYVGISKVGNMTVDILDANLET
jgi:hypothetical protein